MATNYMAVLMEEIALEGLDGITLQGLWVRLENRKDGAMFVDEPMKEFLWKKILTLRNIQGFMLPHHRSDMVLPKLSLKDNHEAEETLFCIMQHMNDLYPFSMVDQKDVRGSCSTFDTRVELPRAEFETASLEECNEKFGNRLVLVASQDVRMKALLGSHPIWSDMGIQQYCVLESIGRGRHFGMYSFGPASLQEQLKADPRSMFYIRNKLLCKGIVTKQMHILKGATTMCRTYLLQLSRFHTTFKSNITVRQEKVLRTLLAEPGKQMVYTNLREAVEMDPLPFKKMIAVMHSNGVIALESVPYRQIFPDASDKEAHTKAGVEKLLRLAILKRDTLEEVKPDDDGDSDDEDKDFPGLLDQTNQTLDRTLLYQAYQATEVAGADGLTQRQIGSMLGLSKLDSRAICKQLTKEGFVSLQMTDVGRQRITKYTAIRLQRKDYKLALEKEKFISLTGSSALLENLMYSGHKAPQNFVLKSLTEQAMDVSIGDDVQIAEMDIDADTPTNPIEAELPEDDNIITYRTLKRMNFILSLVIKYKVISDFSTIQKLICEEEQKEGYQYKIDRRSLFRLIAKMQKSKCVKLYKAVIKTDSTTRSLTFVCSMDVESDNSLIQSEVDQVRLRFSRKNAEKDETDHVDGTPHSVSQLHQISRLEGPYRSLEIDTKNRYGHSARFVRMRLMHQLLFYLTWDYSGDPNLDQDSARLIMEEKKIYMPPECPQIYRTADLDFRTFVPPLPVHQGWPSGWALLADVVLRVPLIMFTRLVRLRHVVPGLEDYMIDPVRRYYLLGQLPIQMRADILGRTRKFVFSLFEAVQKLCYLGLVQFGTQRLKEKDQQFFYVNRKAVLLDTTSSSPRYFQIDTTQSYPRLLHVLNNLADLESYWINVYNVCMTTKLGQKTTDVGKEITIESVETKHVLIEACQIRQADEAPTLDVGILPGDQLGASGLDSALFSHLKRNWAGKGLPRELRFVILNPPKPKQLPPKKVKVQRVEARPVASKQSATKRARGRITKRVLQTRILKAAKKRRVVPPANFKFRVKWSAEEDFILILCKVASIYLTKDELANKVPVPPPVLVNILHKYAPRVYKKDAIQCMRRMANLFNKSSSGRSRVALYLDEAHQCPKINAKFANLIKRLKEKKLSAQQYQTALAKGFEDLVLMLRDKEQDFAFSNRIFTILILPDTIEEFHAKYQVYSALESSEDRKKYLQPNNTEEIQLGTVISLLISSIALSTEREKFTSLLLHVFQQYPDHILHAAVQWTRRAGIVVVKRRHHKLSQKSLLVPLVSSPYHFSTSYYFLLQSKVPFEVYQEARPMLTSLEDQSEAKIEVPKVMGGTVAILLEGLAAGFLTTSIDISSQNVRVEFEPDIAQKEQDKLYEAFEVVDACQKRLDNFQESEIADIPAKRQKMESKVITRSDICFSDDEDSEGTDSVSLQVEESDLTAKERIIKENVEARLAFYAKREELQDSRSVNEKRDRRARLTIEPCPVICTKIAELPGNIETALVLEKMKSSALVTKRCPGLNEVLQSYCELNASEADIMNATLLIQMISDAKENGIAIQALKDSFNPGEGVINLETHLGLLISLGMIIRTGVISAQYVLSSYCSPWIIDSLQYDEDISENRSISVAIRPWIKVDGALNRRALDRYLGSILNFLITSPGCTLASLHNRFVPAMQPFHVQELVEILSTLGCVEVTSMKELPFDLFSDPSEVEIGPANFTEYESAMALEPTVDAISRLTQFIGEKEYSSNFLDEMRVACNLDSAV